MIPMRSAVLAVGLFGLACGAVRGQEAARSNPSDRQTALDFAAKVMEIVGIVHEHHIVEHSQAELVAWAILDLYERLGEKIPPELSKRLDRIKDLKPEEQTTLLVDARQHLGKRRQLTEKLDLHLYHALNAMLRRLDPHGSYEPEVPIPTTVMARYGIGVRLEKEGPSSPLRVVTPLKNSPAYRAGIRAGDVILQIGVEDRPAGESVKSPRVFPTASLSLEEAEQILRGSDLTSVHLRIQRAGADQPLELTVPHGPTVPETVLGIRRDERDDWVHFLDKEKNIAYVRFTCFTHSSLNELERVLAQLRKQGIRGLVLDLRGNSSPGWLSCAVKVAGLFLKDELIVTIRPRVREEEERRTEKPGDFGDLPLVCLLDGQSASGSELVAACLQDHKRAVIVGERSHGKGSVQNMMDFEGGVLKFTTAVFYRPSGKKLDRIRLPSRDDDEWGVTPDKGFDLRLPADERAQLTKHLRDMEMILSPDQAARQEKPAFRDRELELALEYLRSRLTKP